MRLALVRHAQRDYGQPEDGGLSLSGKVQAETLARYFEASWSGPITLMSSPKRRCQETARPTAQRLGLTLTKIINLDECLATESSTSFENRVASTIHGILSRKTESHIIIVSHSDWLEVAALSLCPRADALERARLKLDNAALHLLDIDEKQITFLQKNFRPT